MNVVRSATLLIALGISGFAIGERCRPSGFPDAAGRKMSAAGPTGTVLSGGGFAVSEEAPWLPFPPFSLQKHSFFAQHTCFAYVKKGSVAEISPDLLPDAAARRWQTAILRCPELLVELAAEELSFDCRHLPAQREVRLIRRYLC